MKICDQCGAKNATRAKYCSSCGAGFRIVDAKPTLSLNKTGESDGATFDSDSARLNEAAAKLGAGLWSALVGLFAILRKLAAPAGRLAWRAARDLFAKAIASPRNWDPRRPPNFLYWGLIQFLAFRLPFGVVGIVFATLANVAKEEGDLELARTRAESAKNWLLFDLCAGVIYSVLKLTIFA